MLLARILQRKDNQGDKTMDQEVATHHNEVPEKSEEFKRFENLALRMFNTPKMETETPKKASVKIDRLNGNEQANIFVVEMI